MTKNELRCFCARAPLLAMYGIDKGKLYLHIRVFKQRRVYGEVFVEEGTVQIHCRECLRWHRIKVMQPNAVKLEETPAPGMLADDEILG